MALRDGTCCQDRRYIVKDQALLASARLANKALRSTESGRTRRCARPAVAAGTDGTALRNRFAISRASPGWVPSASVTRSPNRRDANRISPTAGRLSERFPRPALKRG